MILQRLLGHKAANALPIHDCRERNAVAVKVPGARPFERDVHVLPLGAEIGPNGSAVRVNGAALAVRWSSRQAAPDVLTFAHRLSRASARHLSSASLWLLLRPSAVLCGREQSGEGSASPNVDLQ